MSPSNSLCWCHPPKKEKKKNTLNVCGNTLLFLFNCTRYGEKELKQNPHKYRSVIFCPTYDPDSIIWHEIPVLGNEGSPDLLCLLLEEIWEHSFSLWPNLLENRSYLYSLHAFSNLCQRLPVFNSRSSLKVNILCCQMFVLSVY